MAGRLARVLLLQRSVERGVEFYSNGLGLPIRVHTEQYAELSLGPSVPPLALLQRETEAALSVGYSPFLHFTVDDVDEAVKALVLRGASLDGPVKHPARGKVASLRAPDGHMIGLSPTDEHNDHTDDADAHLAHAHTSR
jgi:catechol 2,3-dioxygenase-like lactoylglutathione lyase family enzyme